MYHFQCDECDFARDIDYVPRVYVFPDGCEMAMMQRHIWCEHCQLITVAEALAEDPNEHQWRLERRETHKQALVKNDFRFEFERDLRRQWIRESEELEQKIADWQSVRTRPPFCLQCNSESISVPSSSWNDLKHQPCAGTLKCSATMEAGTFIDRREPHKYDLEGELIERGVLRATDGTESELYLWCPELL